MTRFRVTLLVASLTTVLMFGGLLAAGRDDTFVGRIREDESIPNGINMWIVADNIRKGAATNTVQIAQVLAKEYL